MDNLPFSGKNTFILQGKIARKKVWTTLVFSVDKFVEFLWNCPQLANGKVNKNSKSMNKN